jgi:hypothetical protein
MNERTSNSSPGLAIDCRAEHGADAVGRHCPCIGGVRQAELAFNEINRGNQDESSRNAGLEGKIKRLA